MISIEAIFARKLTTAVSSSMLGPIAINWKNSTKIAIISMMSDYPISWGCSIGFILTCHQRRQINIVIAIFIIHIEAQTQIAVHNPLTLVCASSSGKGQSQSFRRMSVGTVFESLGQLKDSKLKSLSESGL
jgi:hypothetical protein